MQVLTKEELATYDGKNGRPAYVAYKDRIYNVTASFLWKGGKHQALHFAGRDLTQELERAPHDSTFLEKYPLVGTLIEKM